MNEPQSSRSMRPRALATASETAAAELPDFYNRLASAGNGVGVLWAANYPVP